MRISDALLLGGYGAGVSVYLLNAAGLLDPALADSVLQAAEETVAGVQSELALEPADLVLCDYPGLAVPGQGVGGYAPGPRTAFIALESTDPAFAHWQVHLPSTIAHELHHVRHWQGPGYGATLLDSLVSEGLATLFEVERFDRVPAYASAVSNLEELWSQAQPLLERTDQHPRWFFGAGDLPQWAGCSLGYEMARRYCAAAETSAVGAVWADASDVGRAWES